MTPTRYFLGASPEQFPPEALLQQAVAAERADFDGEIVFQALWSWAKTDEAAFEAAASGRAPSPTNNSGADPLRAIAVYGEQVLPALRGSRV